MNRERDWEKKRDREREKKEREKGEEIEGVFKKLFNISRK